MISLKRPVSASGLVPDLDPDIKLSNFGEALLAGEKCLLFVGRGHNAADLSLEMNTSTIEDNVYAHTKKEMGKADRVGVLVTVEL